MITVAYVPESRAGAKLCLPLGVADYHPMVETVLMALQVDNNEKIHLSVVGGWPAL